MVARAEPAGAPLLKHLQLLFVPPGVGALTQLSTLVQNAGPLALAVVGSFAAGLSWPAPCSRSCCAAGSACERARARSGFRAVPHARAYLGAGNCTDGWGRPALLAPVLVAMVVVAVALEVLGIGYDEYLASVSVLTLLLGPATVALALPLLRSGRALLADRGPSSSRSWPPAPSASPSPWPPSNCGGPPTRWS